MRKLLLSMILMLSVSFVFVANNSENAINSNFENESKIIERTEIVSMLNDDCGGCIAWADSRDDGSDRSLRQWRRDVNSCRANSSECSDEPQLFPTPN